MTEELKNLPELKKINKTPAKFKPHRTDEWFCNQIISIDDCIELMGLHGNCTTDRNNPEHDDDYLDVCKKQFENFHTELSMTANDANTIANFTRHHFKALKALQADGYEKVEVTEKGFIKIENKEN